jgi:hypothetical protein
MSQCKSQKFDSSYNEGRENENISTTVLTGVRITVRKINFPDVATFVLLLWHYLLFSVHECFHKLHKKCLLIGLKQLFYLLTSLYVRKSNFHWFKHFSEIIHLITWNACYIIQKHSSIWTSCLIYSSTSLNERRKKTIFARKHLTVHTS